MVPERRAGKHRASSGVRTGPKGVPYDVGDDAGDADIRHPGYCALWGENRVGSQPAKQGQPGMGNVGNLGPQRARRSARAGEGGLLAPPTGSTNRMPPENQPLVGSGLLRGGGDGGCRWSPGI